MEFVEQAGFYFQLLVHCPNLILGGVEVSRRR